MGKPMHNKVNKEILKERLKQEEFERTTLSFYKYHHILNPQLFRDHFYTILSEINVFGRIYVSNEGINGQINVPKDNLDVLRNCLDQIDFLQNLRLNIAREQGLSFYKLIIKVREKIVADGLDDNSFDVTKKGIHINAKEFNELSAKEETVIVDMRNHYESEVGHFKKAIRPDVETFKESLPIVEDILSDKKDNPIIMYCTGGIRCEKASAYFKHKGFNNIYQLNGGIIEYARQVESEGLENKFIGKNFVFDDRLGERISEDIIAKCHQCGNPCDNHTNCVNDACHILFIQCDHCAEKLDNCCSTKCQDFNKLPEEERKEKRKSMEFNGTKFGKGRYKAHRKDMSLDE